MDKQLIGWRIHINVNLVISDWLVRISRVKLSVNKVWKRFDLNSNDLSFVFDINHEISGYYGTLFLKMYNHLKYKMYFLLEYKGFIFIVMCGFLRSFLLLLRAGFIIEVHASLFMVHMLRVAHVFPFEVFFRSLNAVHWIVQVFILVCMWGYHAIDQRKFLIGKKLCSVGLVPWRPELEIQQRR